MIFSVRGTNGSGKSTAIRKLMDQFRPRPLFGVLGPRSPEAYELRPPAGAPIYILGPYVTPTGGADSIQPYELIPQLMRKYAVKGHVVLEGVLITSSYGSVGAVMEEFKRDAHWIFLKTTLGQCIANVEKRRGDRGNHEPFNPKNLEQKFNQNIGVRKRVLALDTMTVADLNSDDVASYIIKAIKTCPVVPLKARKTKVR
jgi:hypothetical protein